MNATVKRCGFGRWCNSSHGGVSCSGSADPNQKSSFLRRPAYVSQPQPGKMQSQMQSQTKINLTMPSILLKIMVSRAGLEPATTALKVRCSTN